MNDIIKERIGRIQHEIWTHWMTYLFSVSEEQTDGSFLIPVKQVERWKRQMSTSYDNLSENEKDSDREQAEKVIKLIREYPEV